MSHGGSLIVPSNRIISISIKADYALPVTTTQGLKFHVHSISLVINDAPTPTDSNQPNSTSPSQPNSSSSQGSFSPSSTDGSREGSNSRMYTAAQMGIMGGILGAVIFLLLGIAAWYFIRRNQRRNPNQERPHGLTVLGGLVSESRRTNPP
jgi:hypothetical protein